MLEGAEDELLYVNFVFGLGTPHLCNDSIIADYQRKALDLRLQATRYPPAVARFSEILISKAETLPRFTALVLAETSLEGLFFHRLAEIEPYKSLNSQRLLDEERVRRGKILDKGKFRPDHSLNAEDLKVTEIERLPLQLMITHVKRGEREERKPGCLVFLVGTENVGGVPVGYYTELGHVVEMYRNLAMGLIESVQRRGAGPEAQEATERLVSAAKADPQLKNLQAAAAGAEADTAGQKPPANSPPPPSAPS